MGRDDQTLNQDLQVSLSCAAAFFKLKASGALVLTFLALDAQAPHQGSHPKLTLTVIAVHSRGAATTSQSSAKLPSDPAPLWKPAEQLCPPPTNTAEESLGELRVEGKALQSLEKEF